jgi:hypothetical protein
MDHVGGQRSGLDDAAQTLELRRFAADHRAVRADVLLVHQGIEAARQLARDFLPEALEVRG